MSKKRKKILIIIVIIICIVALVMLKIVSDSKANMDQLGQLVIQDVDLANIPDGNYDGSYIAFPIDVEVVVTVDNHKISNIDLVKHTNGQGKMAESILGRVIENQTLQVDVVTGATYSSKVILKSIENALNDASK